MNDDTLEHELDSVMKRAGIVIPAERKAGVLAGYMEQARMTALLRIGDRAAESEPASFFAIAALNRALRRLE